MRHFIQICLPQNISNFCSDLESFQYIGDAIDQSLNIVGTAKKETEQEQAQLEDKKNKQTDLQYQAQLEKKFLDARTAEKNQLMKVTKGQEQAYQKVCADLLYQYLWHSSNQDPAPLF